MPTLYNKYDKKTLEKLIEEENNNRLTLSFYQYYQLKNPFIFRDHLYLELQKLGVLGRIYVSFEGINAQINVPENNFELLRKSLDEITFLKGIRLNEAIEHDKKSFLKLIIKVRQKIVADGLNDETFDVTNKGKHLKADEFNALADDPNTIIIDMRNHYESEVGRFKNAITPDVDSFREALVKVEEELVDKKDKNLVMYCTGGIRCEKASAYYKHKGFEKVFQLEGGIIEYTRKVKELGLENKFVGKNFVFDNRLGERISEDVIAVCHQCGTPCDTHINCANQACHLLFIQCETCALKFEKCCSKDCQDFIHLPEEEQKIQRKGKVKEERFFKKGRSENLLYKS